MAIEDLKCKDFMRGNIYLKKMGIRQESLAEPSDHRCLKDGEKAGSFGASVLGCSAVLERFGRLSWSAGDRVDLPRSFFLA